MQKPSLSVNLPSASVGLFETYNTVPQGSVVPENHILLVMAMCVDVFGRQDRPHDPDFSSAIPIVIKLT